MHSGSPSTETTAPIIGIAPPDLWALEDPDEGVPGIASDAAFEVRHFRVPVSQHGGRIDRALGAVAPEFSRTYLQQLVIGGAVSLAGRAVVKPSARVRAGDAGTIVLKPTPESQAFVPEPMALNIVYSDPYLCVLNKPPGLVVHPAPGNWSGTLLNGLLAEDPLAALLPRAGIVHRLDKDTSGLMVVARTRAAMDGLVQRIAARSVQRQYVTIAHYPWAGPARRAVDAPIGRDPRNRLRMAVVDLAQHSGKHALTNVELLDNTGTACLVRCTLDTGRTHQIRVHMAHIGHPLVGDTVYGGSPAFGMQRQALHAFRLALEHPITGAALDFRAALPDDFQAALGAQGLRYTAG